MPLNRHTLIRLFALAVIVGAVLAPAASARPISESPSGQGTVATPIMTLPLEFTTVGKSNGFDWADAGIGAGVVVALVAAGFAFRLTTRRNAEPSTASRPPMSAI
jgi:hypothetical protein